jgi:hypothetical protein
MPQLQSKHRARSMKANDDKGLDGFAELGREKNPGERH